MAINPDEVRKIIEAKIPGSTAHVENTMKDGQHYEIYVAYAGFKNKSLVEQHKAVHDAIKDVRDKMHAVVIKTQTMITDEENWWKEGQTKIVEKGVSQDNIKGSNLKEKIREAISHHDVTIFIKGTPSQPLCGFSSRVVSILNELGIKYKAVNIFDDVNIKQTLVEMTGWPTTPQVFIKGTLIGGCDITEEMYASGELQKVLKEAKILA